MTYKNILFDIDNTLIDSANIAAKALQQAVTKYGHEISVATIRNMVGLPTDKILQQLNLTPAKEITADFIRISEAHHDELEFFSGIQTLLANLKQNAINIGVVTSRTAAEVATDLGAFSEITSLKMLVTADKTTEHKPSGAPLIYALDNYHLDPTQTMYVGDTIYDLKSALAANLDFASAGWGALPQTDFSQATHQPAQPAELLDFVLA